MAETKNDQTENEATRRSNSGYSEGKAARRSNSGYSENREVRRNHSDYSGNKTVRMNIDSFSEGRTEQGAGSYSFEEPALSLVSEALAEYAVSRQQGEYTLEDYLAWPKEQRVELIDGVIYDMAASTYIHQAVGDRICGRLSDYIEKKHGLCMAFTSPVDVQLDCDDRTVVQPDVIIVCDRDKFRKGRIYGAPDFVAEVLSPSTSRKDRFLKLSKYRHAGVREYWLIDPDRKKVMVYEFEKSDSAKIYGFSDQVPVGIYNGECQVDFAEIYRQIAFLYDTM